MGWSTDLFCNIHFNRKSYNSLYEVENDLEDCNKLISYYKKKLFGFALVTEPDKMFNMEDDFGSKMDAYSYIESEFGKIWDDLMDTMWEKINLEYLIENWKHCHDEEGYAIAPPKEIEWDTAYLCGDFVKTKDNKDEF